MHDLDVGLLQCTRPAPERALYECGLIVAAQVGWLRFMIQIWRESVITDRAQSLA